MIYCHHHRKGSLSDDGNPGSLLIYLGPSSYLASNSLKIPLAYPLTLAELLGLVFVAENEVSVLYGFQYFPKLKLHGVLRRKIEKHGDVFLGGDLPYLLHHLVVGEDEVARGVQDLGVLEGREVGEEVGRRVFLGCSQVAAHRPFFVQDQNRTDRGFNRLFHVHVCSNAFLVQVGFQDLASLVLADGAKVGDCIGGALGAQDEIGTSACEQTRTSSLKLFVWLPVHIVKQRHLIILRQTCLAVTQVVLFKQIIVFKLSRDAKHWVLDNHDLLRFLHKNLFLNFTEI